MQRDNAADGGGACPSSERPQSRESRGEMQVFDMANDERRLRSAEWFDTPELYGWLRKAAFMAEGYGQPAYEGKPIIGICNSWSELTHCNAHLRGLAEAVKRGVLMEAAGEAAELGQAYQG